MKMYLEPEDLLKIIGAHFGTELEEGDVEIRTDPLLIIIKNVTVPPPERPEAYQAQAQPVSPRQLQLPVAPLPPLAPPPLRSGAAAEALEAAAIAQAELPGWDIEPARLDDSRDRDASLVAQRATRALIGDPVLDPTIPPQPGVDGTPPSNRGGESLEAFRTISGSLETEIDRANPNLVVQRARSGGQSEMPPFSRGEIGTRR